MKKEYAPNAWVGVYLLKCGGEDQLPAERFGSAEIKVQAARAGIESETRAYGEAGAPKRPGVRAKS